MQTLEEYALENGEGSLTEPVRELMTVQQHIFEAERHHFPGEAGEISWLLSGITLATKLIQAKVRRAGLNDILGNMGSINVQGEQPQKLDIYANRILMHCLGVRDSVGVLASEENEEPVTLKEHGVNAKYAVLFDPLDGSSNIDVNVSVGTIFTVYRLSESSSNAGFSAGVFQPGRKQLLAGYVVYGSSTVMVYTAGRGVHGFTLDPDVGTFILSHEDMKMPERGKYYSVNEAYRDAFPPAYRTYLDRLRTGQFGKPYALRYIGSLVADFHRTLLKGGVFLYPPTEQHKSGKLRLMYEANPMAFLAEQAGGHASDGTGPILDIEPEGIHQRTVLVIGSRAEMAEFDRCMRA